MKIAAVETIRCRAYGNLLWVRLHTDEGPIGLGETFRNAEATAAYVHETCAPYLLGKDPLEIARHAHALLNEVGNHFSGYPTRSVEVRGNSAIDIALWDLFGQALGRPVHQLLGGLCRERLRIYNTCAGGAYNAQARTAYNTQLLRHGEAAARGSPLDDLEAQMTRPAELAQELLAEGITAMKVWPFDAFAVDTHGQHIAREDMARAVAPIAAIRRAVGDRMDIMLEMHGLWQLPCAVEIAHALSDYGIFWHEDPVPMHNLDDLAAFKRATPSVRVAGSENLGTRAWYREAFARGAIDVAHFDPGWVGGITEGRALAALAGAHDRPIAPHDCTGPVILIACVHLVMSTPNALIQETVRAFTRGYYREIVTELPRIEGGFVYPMAGPGLGTTLSPEFLRREDLVVRTSSLRGA